MENNLILQAFQEATELHKNQYRKYSKRPYVTHLIRVAGRVLTLPDVTVSEVTASVLHDSVEDQCKNEEEQIKLLKSHKDKYGEESEAILWGLTNPTKFSKLPRAERKKIDREHIAAQSLKVKRIKAIDRIDNLTETLNDLTYSNMNSGLYKGLEQWALVYCDESELLAGVLLGVEDNLLLELNQIIVELRRTAEQIIRWRTV